MSKFNKPKSSSKIEHLLCVAFLKKKETEVMKKIVTTDLKSATDLNSKTVAVLAEIIEI